MDNSYNFFLNAKNVDVTGMEGKGSKKGKACKNVGCGEGDINIQPKKKFRVQNIRNFEEIG